MAKWSLLLFLMLQLLFSFFDCSCSQTWKVFKWVIIGIGRKNRTTQSAGHLTATNFPKIFLGWCYCYPRRQIHHPHLYYCHFYLVSYLVLSLGHAMVKLLVGFFSETDKCIEICLGLLDLNFLEGGSFPSPFLRALPLFFSTWDWNLDSF